jgi:hypothetical protein
MNFSPMHHTLVFFHIQKTSGSVFDLDLVNSLQVAYTNTETGRQLTRKACRSYFVPCERSDQNWRSFVLSWHTDFGWSCGLHPGLSDLKECVLGRWYRNADLIARDEDYLFVSMLREPMMRFVSEWRHTLLTGSVWLYEDQAVSKDHQCLKSKILILSSFICFFCVRLTNYEMQRLVSEA